MLFASESTSFDDVSWDFEVTIEKNEHRALFIAVSMIKIENIICEIKNMYDHIMFCVSGKLFVYLLQIKLHLIRKHHFILHNSLCIS